VKKDQKIAIITAASKGIGAACAIQLHRAGFKLVLMFRSKEIYTIADQLDARPIMGSISNPSDIMRLIQFTYEKYGRIDAVIANSGHAAKGSLNELSDAEWQEGFNLLLMSVIRLSKLVTPIFESQKSGSFIAISSFVAKEPSLEYPLSSVMRAALSGFIKLYAETMGKHQVRVNAVLPGSIDNHPTTLETLNKISLLRQGKVSDVASLVTFLCSEDAKYITGQLMTVDGGLIKSI